MSRSKIEKAEEPVLSRLCCYRLNGWIPLGSTRAVPTKSNPDLIGIDGKQEKTRIPLSK
jgi:hypothetical protein